MSVGKAPSEYHQHSHFDTQLFELLRERFRHGEISNRLVNLGEREVLRRAHAHSYGSEDRDKLGVAKVAEGQVAAVILAGGLANAVRRACEAAVELAPGWPLLRIKLELVAQLARRAGARIPTWIIVSRSSQASVSRVLESSVFDDLEIELLQQRMLPRIDADGEVFLDTFGRLSFSPTGHGETLDLLGRQCRREGHEAIRHLVVSNIDNLPGSPQPEALALQDEVDADLVEVVVSGPRDAGGTVVEGVQGVEIIEGFRIDGDLPSTPWLLSTNTFCLRRLTVVDPPHLPWNPVKKNVGAAEVVQFEQLLGDLGIDRRVLPIVVDRVGPEGRFIPLKTADDFDALAEPLIELLQGRGLPI